MKMTLNDIIRVRKVMLDPDKQRSFVTVVEASSEYQSPIKLEFDNVLHGLVQGETIRMTASLDYLFYPSSEYKGEKRQASSVYKVLDYRPFERVELVPTVVKSEAPKKPA